MPTFQEIRESTRQQWNEFSGGWKKWDDLIMESLRRQGEELIKELPDDIAFVLDVATGTGEPGLSIAELFPNINVTGTDLSESMSAIAAENARLRGLNNYRALTADACDLPFSEQKYDAVICRLGIMFFPDPAKGADEFFRVLKPGGKVALTVWNVPSKNEWLAMAGTTVRNQLNLPAPPPEAPGVFRFSEIDLLHQILEKAGFSNVQSREVTGVMRYESASQYINMMLDVAAPIVSALREVSEAKQEVVKSAILSAAKSKAQKDGSLALHWSAWLLTGEKTHSS
ncbi:MAG: class I SAM-dependent methyltransferase [Fidelibacterota bacterium]